MTLTELRTEKGRLAEEADQILKKAGEENRHDLREDEDKKFDAIHADIEKLTKQIQRLEKQETVTASLNDSQGRRSEPNPTQTRQTQNVGRATAQDQDLALRGWLLAGSEDKEPSDEQRLAAKRCGFNLNAGSITLKLAPVALRSLNPRDVEAWEKRAAMGVASGSIGLYTSPDSPMGALERALLSFGGMRQVATVIRTSSGSDMPFPTSDDTSNKGAILAENTQVSEVDITFGQLVLQAFKYSSKLVLVAQELLQDSSVNVPELIGKALGERIGRIQNDHFTTGDASSKPNGIVTASTAGVTATSLTATVTYDFIMDLIHSVDPAYRDNARFMFHDGGLKMLKKTKVLQYSGDTVGAPLWQPSLVAGQPDMIAGYPYVVNQSMTTPATAVKSILFGDLSKYMIRDVADIRLVRMDERYADYDQVGFTAFMRSDGDLLDAGTHPVKHLLQG
jgi:HK97 family phage major capsid protein